MISSKLRGLKLGSTDLLEVRTNQKVILVVHVKNCLRTPGLAEARVIFLVYCIYLLYLSNKNVILGFLEN